MNLFSVLLLGHLLADFPFQTPTILRWKFKGGVYLLPHIAIHAAVMALLIENPLQQWPIMTVIIVSHFIIDWVKVVQGCRMRERFSFLLDQSAHIFILWVVTAVAGITSHQFAFESLPFILALAVMSAVFMYLNVIKAEMERIPVPAVLGKYAFVISKAAGWSAVLSLLASIQFLR